MSKLLNSAFTFLWLALAAPAFAASDPEAAKLIEQHEFHVRGDTLQARLSMRVQHDGSERSLEMRVWSVGRDKAFIRLLKPAKDKDTTNLRIGTELWQYLPNIDRIIKIPPSMMLQSWMGSDFTNDDLVKTSSLVRDYEHKVVGREKIGSYNAVKLECLPKPNAPVVWGKLLLWVIDKQGVPLKQEFYSEKGELLKVLTGSEIKTFGKHTIPTVLVMQDIKKGKSQTTLRYEEAVFDAKIPDSVFTQQNLRANK